MPESLIALGILVVVAILLDGLRRMRNARRDSLQMMRDMNQGVDRSALDEYGNEFPSGPARVVAHRVSAADEPELHDDDPNIGLADTSRRGIDFKQVAPMLMEVTEERQRRIEPEFFSDIDDDETQAAAERDEEYEEDLTTTRVPPPRGVRNASPVFDPANAPLGLGESEILGEPRIFERPADKPAPRRDPVVVKPSKPVIKAREERDQQQQIAAEPKVQKLPLDDDLIIISVVARDRAGFNGNALLNVFMAQGLRYGHFSLFHRYIGQEREEDSLYSVANLVNPGTFDLNRMDNFSAPGITLFLRLPSPSGKPMDAFESMLGTARAVAERLNGELRDENRSVMTNQTIEHCRQRIRNFEMQSRVPAR
ncbi:MAG: cell division protein ZipA [Pseudomonadales bacterium]|nr:cell division protein ZipA [Pseudomonadales bacterium]